jgi:GNAT superfamily N-acetyltransferase
MKTSENRSRPSLEGRGISIDVSSSAKVILRQVLSQTQVNRIFSRIEAAYVSDIRQALLLDEASAGKVAARMLSAVTQEADGGEVGHICCLKSLRRVGEYWYSFDEDLGVARLQYLFVAPQWRKQGYGAAAVAAIHSTLVEQGFGRIELNVFAPNVAALALYRSCGYVVDSHEMVCFLSSSTPRTEG